MFEDLLLDEPRHGRRRRTKPITAPLLKGCLTCLSLRLALAASSLLKHSSNSHLRFGLHLNTFPASFHDMVGVCWDWTMAFRRQASSSRPNPYHFTSCHVSCRRTNEVPGRSVRVSVSAAVTLSQHLARPARRRTASVVTASGRGCTLRLGSIGKPPFILKFVRRLLAHSKKEKIITVTNDSTFYNFNPFVVTKT